MTGPLLGKGSGDDDRTTPTTKEQIEGCLSALRSLVKEHNSRGNVSLIHLNFDEDRDDTGTRTIVTGKKVGDADLKRPFKETAKTPLTRRIIEFAGPEFKLPTYIKLYDGMTDLEDHLSRFASAANSEEWHMPVWCQIQQTLYGNARGWFERLPAGSIDEWKDGRILDVPKIMKISSFMNAHKCPELAKRYSDKVPKTVDDMMVRLDDFVRSEEAFANTEIPKGEVSESSRKLSGTYNRREDRFHRG
ncbi:hypothetical protein Tco_1221551 [Tanacetum coccineum]